MQQSVVEIMLASFAFKVSEMEDELERHMLVRDSLELELQELRHRLSTVEDFTESLSSENCYASLPEDQHFR